MARRRIGQEQLDTMGRQPRGDTSLDEMSRLVDWTLISAEMWIGTSAGPPSKST